MGAELRAVLLDLDGTLVDRDAALRAWLRRRAGLSREIDGLLALDRADRSSLASLGVELHRLRPGLAPDPATLVARIRDELPTWITPDPTLVTALTQLRRAGLALALVSNGGPGQRRKLAAARIPESLFSTLQISGELGRAKPDAAIFEAALHIVGAAPGEALMIGDSPHEDIAGAAALGLATCWVAGARSYPGDYPSDCPAPTRPVRDVHEALASLAQGKSKSRVSASRTSDE